MSRVIVKIYYPADSYTLKLMQRIEDIIPIFTSQFQIKGMDQDDLAQEIRLHVWKKLPQYNVVDYQLKTWLKPVIRNFITDLARHSNRKKRQSPSEEMFLIRESFLINRGLVEQEDEQ